ncbi:MAG: hypothetical protein K0S26_501 [Bacteroidota bacterium]|jgi:hypothetical protein|nr:hypothetical protein [Bacteroidota bacterium]
MRQKTFILFILCLSHVLHGQEKFTLKNEQYFFTPKFIDQNFLMINGDSLNFSFSADTAIVNIDHVWTADNQPIWILYKNQGNFDFWLMYCKKFHYDRESYEKTPKKLIKRYFIDSKIDLIDIAIFSTAVKPLPVKACGNCYDWTDFLFKIKATDLQKLKELSGQQFVIVKNNYP